MMKIMFKIHIYSQILYTFCLQYKKNFQVYVDSVKRSFSW
jgi:hypothetical protein